MPEELHHVEEEEIIIETQPTAPPDSASEVIEELQVNEREKNGLLYLHYSLKIANNSILQILRLSFHLNHNSFLLKLSSFLSWLGEFSNLNLVC